MNARRWLPIATVVGAIGIAGAAVALTRGGPTEPAAWSRLGTQDVHSLAFVGDPQHLLFGHHNGIAETRDGGKTWAPIDADLPSLDMPLPER